MEMVCPNCGSPLEEIPPDRKFLTHEEVRSLSHEEVRALLLKRWKEAGRDAVKAGYNGRLPECEELGWKREP